MSGPLTWLREATAAIVRNEHPGSTLVGDDAIKFMRRGNLRYTRMSMIDGSVTGFRQDGAVAIRKLAQQALKQHKRLKHGARRADVDAHIAEAVLKRYAPRSAGKPEAVAPKEIEDGLLAWFDATAGQQRHYVPCALIDGRAEPFDVGPVTFVHVNDFASHPRSLPDNPLTEFTRDPLIRALAERHATWIAIVEVENCQPKRSSELADLATDVAIGAVQMAMPGDTGERMVRLTARTLPPWRGSVAIAGGYLRNELKNMVAGHRLDPRTFEVGIALFEPMLASAGDSLDGLVSGDMPFQTLRAAWCDAVYWHHEATSEALTTVAAVKFETAIEAMLRTKKKTGSGNRIKQAIRILTGMDADDALPGSPELKVESYAKFLAEARSQVLHGTISTLADEVGEERHALAWLARTLLTAIAVAFDDFMADTAASDDVESLIAWFDRRRATAGTANPSGSG